MAIPATPSNVYVQQGNAQVLVSWDLLAGAVNYPVLRSTDNVNFTVIASPTETSYLDTSVVPNTQYFYAVKANNGTVDSSPSAAQGIIPTASGIESLASIRLQAQQQADRVGSKFVSLPEWNKYINQSYFELYDLLITTFEDYYMAAPYTFTTVSNTTSYALPPDFYKLLGLDASISVGGQAYLTLKKFNWQDRNNYVYPTATGTVPSLGDFRYRLMGSAVQLVPPPADNINLRMWYIPRLQTLLKDTDVADGVSGWIEFIVVDAAIKALQKEESDVSLLEGRRQQIIDRIQSTATNRDAGEPSTIVRVNNSYGRYGGFGGGTL